MECFICSSNTPPLYQVCKCNTLVHSECFQKLILTVPSHQKQCAICREAYDIKDIINRTFKCSTYLIVISFIFILLDVAFIILLLNAERSEFYFICVGFIFTSICSVSLYIKESKRFQSMCCCKIEIDVKRKRITLPTPVLTIEQPV